MENQVVERRMSRILAHFSANEELPTNNHLIPMNCSSSLKTGINNTVIRRCDNRMLFARQGGPYQASFMRQISTKQDFEQESSLQQETSLSCSKSRGRCDNRLLFARQGSLSQGSFMRQISTKQDFEHGSLPQQDIPLSCSKSVTGNGSYDYSGPPVFSRPAQTDSNISFVRDNQPVMQAVSKPSKFSRPNGFMEQMKGKNKPFLKNNCSGTKWSPRMDIAESEFNYVVTVELPGVGTSDIKVEVDDQNLIVMGKRSTEWWRVANISADSKPTYLQREIFEGPYQVVWPVPNDVNKDAVSAEFVDGFLQITLPKL